MPVQAVQWEPCTGNAGPAKYECATVQVPRNPLKPSDGTIGMAIDRRPASGQKIGSLLVNPGGPGASGVDALPTLISSMPPDLLARFDVVGFDPPGVGRTAPIVCLDSAGLERYYHVDPEPTTPSAFNAMLSADRNFAAGCESRSGAELPYVSTADAAMDMDVLRRDLGDPQLTYMGFSYGTLLGATYADLFPKNVRAMVLDGALDPALPVIDELDQQAAGLDGQLQQFFAWCRARPSCGWSPAGDPRAAFEALLAKVKTSPLPAKGTARTVGPAEVTYGTAVTLYSTTTWGDLGLALGAASHGDGTYMLELFDAYTGRQSDGSYDNLFEANAAVNCLDAAAPSISAIQAAAPKAESMAPVFGLQNLYSEATCSVWPVPATGRVGPLHANGSAPIVVVGSTGDPITPYQWAQALAGELENGVLLTRVGDGHTGYRSSSCIRAAADSYLINLTVPPAGTRCASD
ncbi:MAG TPA: alpha/beta hydrolase [Acidimicrobiales bacterium]|nr:alpha/beta hydrolase [Acidimicrobiales bacterium]